jgi:hypothetical protein
VGTCAWVEEAKADKTMKLKIHFPHTFIPILSVSSSYSLNDCRHTKLFRVIQAKRACWQALPMIVARARPLYLWISARLSLFFFFYLSLFWLICWCTILFLSIIVYVNIYVRSLFFFFLFFTVHHFYVFSSLYVHLFVSFVFFFFFFHRNTFT